MRRDTTRIKVRSSSMTGKLTEKEIEKFLKANPDWKLQEGKLVREWSFKDFVGAMAFVNQTATIAESTGHHPDIDIRYNRVLLALVSHDAGGITDRDIAMASRINLGVDLPRI
jgi:4a-hydroxytetrahydrobiopterin dehydratase